MEKRILIVDDEKMIRKMMNQAFSMEGYRVYEAESGEDALKLLANEKVQVMFLDLNLPGMDGIELCREIRKSFPLAVIYALTGYASLYELADCREAGFDDYFTKPASLDVLSRAAKEAFERLARWQKRDKGLS